jgi:glycosyltransferase involved in cell wall biosynthesis
LRYAADHLVTVNTAIERELLEKLRVPRVRLSVIPGAVDAERFHPTISGASIREEFRLDPDISLVGIVARMVPSRGHLTLVQAFARVHVALPRTRLVIVGRGEFRPAVEKEVCRLGLTEAVIFAGYRSEDLPEVLAALDLFVLLAPGSEGSGRAVLEAMAMGKPVVAGRVGALAETIVDGETGLLVDPHSPADVAKAICNLLHFPPSARQMGILGRKRIETHFARGRQVSDTLSLYQGLLLRQDTQPKTRAE